MITVWFYSDSEYFLKIRFVFSSSSVYVGFGFGYWLRFFIDGWYLNLVNLSEVKCLVYC